MAREKNYWDTIKNDETFYHGGARGWEVHLRKETHYMWDSKTGTEKKVTKLEFKWPYFDGVPRAERALCRKDILAQRKKERILAQASRDREEYRDLCARVQSEKWDEILKTGITGFPLGNYIRHNFLTYSEAHSLFYRM